MAGAQQMEILRSFETGNDVRQIISCSEQGRALKLLKKREETKARAEAAMAEIENETKKRRFSSIHDKFGGNSQADMLEEEFKKQTVGLISKDEFMAKRKAIDEIIEQAGKNKNLKIRAKRTVKTTTLSFQDDPDADELASSDDSGDEEEKQPFKIKKSFGKDPTIDTSFLYDGDREFNMQRKKQELIKEYNDQQELLKNQKLEVTYSYWDGSGHRRTCTVEKGWQIGQFLAKCKKDLEKTDFPELRATTLDMLMYVKEDLIIPHNVTFYDLIKERVHGKTGPLFHFDVHDDLRAGDVRVQKDDSHAGKIVDRKWYERNKHIFPASRWENYEKGKGIRAGEGQGAEPKLIQTLRG